MTDAEWEKQYRNHIEIKYNEFIKQIADGSLYGQPVDMDDQKAVVIAAYYLGWMEGAALVPRFPHGLPR